MSRSRTLLSMISACLLVLASLTVPLTVTADTAKHEGWTRLATKGIDNPGVTWCAPIKEYGGKVYLFTSSAPGSQSGVAAPVWTYGPGGFEKAASDGFGNGNNQSMYPLVEHQDTLYCGTANDKDGAQLWRTPDGENWQKVGENGLGDADNVECFPLGVHDGRVILGCQNYEDGVKAYAYDGNTLSRANEDSFGLGYTALSFGVEYRGKLYVVARNEETGECRPLRYDGGTTWTPVGQPGFGDPNNTIVLYLMTDGSKIYAGTGNQFGAQVWSYDGNDWSQVAANGIDDPDNFLFFAFQWGNTLYIASVSFDQQGKPFGTGKLYRQTEGGAFERWVSDGLGDADNAILGAGLVYYGKILLGTYNPNGFQVWEHPALSETYYFAEGTTRSNENDGIYQEWLTIANPDDTATDVDITYMLGTGENIDADYTVEADSRLTVDVASDVGLDQDVSVLVEAEKPVVAERPMYFDYRNKWTGGHVVTGAPGPSMTYYFAEGTTRSNPLDGEFEEWICIQNPGGEDAVVTLTYMLGTGETRVVNYPVEACSRETVEVEADVGSNQDVSVLVESTQPIVAERPMYFDYHGMYPGGHDVVGANAPSTRLYFAEGCTHPWADEWLCIQNPQPVDAKVTLTYQITGEAEVVEDVTVPATSRHTVDVKAAVGEGKDVSVTLDSDQPVVAERPMYFDYHDEWPGGHDVMGSEATSSLIYFAEGTTRYNPQDGYFEEWLCLQNPGDESAVITVNFLKTDGNVVEYDLALEPKTRTTLDVNEILGPDVDAAIFVESDQPVVSERPMYFDYHGFATGGHDAMGYGI